VKKLPDCFALSEISTLSTEPDRPIAAAFTAHWIKVKNPKATSGRWRRIEGAEKNSEKEGRLRAALS
jgi:hypothetical protein